MSDLSSIMMTDELAPHSGTTSDPVRDLIVCYCTNCLQLIAVTKRLDQDDVRRIAQQRCPRCSLELSETVTSRGIRAPLSDALRSHPAFQASRRTEGANRAVFTPATSLSGLRSSVRFVDDLLGGLKQGTVALIKGPVIATALAERYCLRVQLPEPLGGLDGRAYFLDGGNSFDVYLFASIAREHGLDLNGALERLVITRAFTAYELLELVRKDSRIVFDVYNPRLFVISDVFRLPSQDIDPDEGIRILHCLGRAIKRISRERGVPVVVTASAKADQLEFIFRDYCDTVLELQDQGNQIAMDLLKHPSRPPRRAIQETPGGYNQQTILPPRLLSVG